MFEFDAGRLMIPWNKINWLRRVESEAKERGDLAAMLPVREEILRLYEIHGGEPKDVANSLNQLAWIKLRIGDLEGAELAAKRSISWYSERILVRDETLATYHWMLAMIHAEQGRFIEAAAAAEEGIEGFRVFHGDDEFVRARQAELRDYRDRARRP